MIFIVKPQTRFVDSEDFGKADILTEEDDFVTFSTVEEAKIWMERKGIPTHSVFLMELKV